MPLLRAHTRDQRGEPSPAAAVQLDEVICHETQPSHYLSLQACGHPPLPTGQLASNTGMVKAAVTSCGAVVSLVRLHQGSAPRRAADQGGPYLWEPGGISSRIN
jgi:hypothetical protein